MTEANRLNYLHIALWVVGLIFIFGIWPSGWAWHAEGRSHLCLTTASTRTLATLAPVKRNVPNSEEVPEMTSASKPDEKSKGPVAPSGPCRPKRGAFPTPKEEIERAKPYVPESDQATERPEVNPAPPTRVDEKKRD